MGENMIQFLVMNYFSILLHQWTDNNTGDLSLLSMMSLLLSFLMRFGFCLEVLELNGSINKAKGESGSSSDQSEGAGTRIRSRWWCHYERE
uniref:Uncharacterized protein n=1 Tax=Glycine max TaxID=3847 RepID=C6T1M1_SOYBN|nr:unknown [Glycine max]